MSTGLLPSRHWSAVVAETLDAALFLFAEGWSSGDQVAIIGATSDRACDLLARSDLCDTKLEGQEALFGAAVDGAGALIAAASADGLQAMLEAIGTELRHAGFAVIE